MAEAAAKILIVDDEPSLREYLAIALEREGYEVGKAESGEEARRLLEEDAYDLALVDLRMPGADGLEVLRRAKSVDPTLMVVMMTAYSTVETAVEAMKEGAFDYLIKPFKTEVLKVQIRRALEHRALHRENVWLRREVETKYRFENIVGKSPKMQELFETIVRVAGSRATVLVVGERGTGKELVARAIHFNSPRKGGPFVPLNCSAIPQELMESELFGHVKGAFTGAVASREGVFELAHGGTLFLDEISEIPLTLQAKLLRVIQEREFRRVGGTKEIRVDVRIISATNRNLTEAVAKGSFRDDLFDRLNVVQLNVPPLRDRAEDIPLLVYHFLQRFSSEVERPIKLVAPEALALLEAYQWPGNVRELENLIERAVTLARSDRIDVADLPESILRSSQHQPVPIELPSGGISIERVVAAVERSLLEQALRRTGGIQTKAAELLGCSLRSFRYLVKKYGIVRDGSTSVR
ncbi:MAG: sigma-54-dependent Fis family transcriptional regulator [Candidatus Rokubacteria bacterium]|nr:sigma-54-dependent Fis family transcriptional regulator [Candidatus Rokubacteria bacterium]